MSRRNIPPVPFGSDWTAWALELNEYLTEPDQHEAENTPVIIQLTHQLTGQTYKALEDGILMFDATADEMVCSIGGEWKGLAVIDDPTFTGRVTVNETSGIQLNLNTTGGLTLDREASNTDYSVHFTTADVAQWNLGPLQGVYPNADFAINRFNAAGAFLESTMKLEHDTGAARFTGVVSAGDAINATVSFGVDDPTGTSNTHLWFRRQGVNRALIYQNWTSASGGLEFNMYDTGGTYQSSAFVEHIDGNSRFRAGDFYAVAGNYYGPDSNFGARIQNNNGGFSTARDVQYFGWTGGHGNPTTIAWTANNSSAATWGYCWADVWSDRRLKKNIHSTERDVLSELMKLNVVSYEWNDQGAKAFGNAAVEGRKVEVGLIAQEVEEFEPDAVMYVATDPDEKDRTAMINKKELVPHLIRAIQQLAERVETLENERKGE